MGVNSSVIPGRGEASNPESRDDRSEIPGSRLRAHRNDGLYCVAKIRLAAGPRPDNLAAPKFPITRRVDPDRSGKPLSPGSAVPTVAFVVLDGIVPVDRFHERIDVAARLGAIVHVIGMLVHVERDNRPSARNRIGMVSGPLIDETFVAGRIHQQRPAGTAALRLAHRRKFRTPTFDAAKVAHKRVRKRAARRSTAAEAVEIGLVQNHRVHRDQLFALQSVDDEPRRLGKIQFGELCGNRGQALDRADVVVFVVADKDLFGDSLYRFRIERKRLDLIRHRFCSRWRRRLGVRRLLNQRRRCRYPRGHSYAVQKIPTFDIVCHRSRSWFLLIVDQFGPIEIARERNGATLVPSTRTSMSGWRMGAPIRRADLSDEIGSTADMSRPCGTIGRDSLACRLMRRSLPHAPNTLDEARACQSDLLWPMTTSRDVEGANKCDRKVMGNKAFSVQSCAAKIR